METSKFLARHHLRLVNQFIESVLDEVDLGDLERNVVGVALHREVETELVPGIVATQAVFHAAGAAVLGGHLSEWLARVSSVIPAESAFLTEMGQQVDPVGYDLLTENWGSGPRSRRCGGRSRLTCGRWRPASQGVRFRDVQEARHLPGLPVVGILSLLGLGLSFFTLQR